MNIREIFTNKFQVTIDQQRFWYQYKYRHTSVSYMYKKDFISALGMLILFQYINFKYLTLFNTNTWTNIVDPNA